MKEAAAPNAPKSSLPGPDLRELVAVRAYFLAQQSGFEAGREMDFWLQAESQTQAETLAPAAEKPRRARKPRAKKSD